MKTKILIVLAVILIFTGAIYLNEYSNHNPLAWCFKDENVCRKEAMDKLRAEREGKKDALKKAIVDTDNHYNPIINEIKLGLDGATIQEELKAGRKENVPEGILSLRNALIPLANASSGETMLDVPVKTSVNHVGVRFAPDYISVGRYGEVLADLGSPYASVPIEKYCNENGLKSRQCDLLVGIAQRESQNGTDFKCNYKTKEEANKLGQEYYHNPVGIKDFSKDGTKKNPDANGCYLRKFDSWDSFWAWYVPHMANPSVYNWKNVTDVTYLSGCYVKGKNKQGYCLPPSMSWTNTVHGFAEKIQQANS